MIYVTADLHGYPLKQFKELLRKVHFSEEDCLYVLGDVIDRGPDGINLLRWMMCQPNIEMILGNHEAMMLECEFLLDEITDNSLQALTSGKLDALANWIANGGEITIAALRKLSVENRHYIFDYLKETPLYDIVSTNNRHFLLTHSGLGHFSHTKDIDEYSEEDLLWNRPALSDEYYDKVMTIFGHTPTINYGEAFAGKAIVTRTWINIDAGAGWGFSPMLLCLDTLEEFYRN